MREIKFRGWDKAVLKMFYMDCYKESFVWHYKHGAELMQFTGLKDKNGKEIYEGDIIKQKGSPSCVAIKWEDTERTIVTGGPGPYEARNVKDGEFYSYDAARNRIVGFIIDGYYGCIHDIEVIGNIYEHGHLLK